MTEKKVMVLNYNQMVQEVLDMADTPTYGWVEKTAYGKYLYNRAVISPKDAEFSGYNVIIAQSDMASCLGQEYGTYSEDGKDYTFDKYDAEAYVDNLIKELEQDAEELCYELKIE